MISVYRFGIEEGPCELLISSCGSTSTGSQSSDSDLDSSEPLEIINKIADTES